MTDQSELWAAVKVSYDANGLIALSNIRDRTASAVDDTVGTDAALQVIDLWPLYAQVAYDNTDSQHLAVAKRGTIAVLYERGGSSSAIAKVEWDEVFGDGGLIIRPGVYAPRIPTDTTANQGVDTMARATFDKGAKVARWERKLANPSAALKQIGVFMVAESQQAFREQRFGDERWPPRGVPNVMAIIEDFHAGKREPPARRFERRPALMDTGRLAASIAFRLIGREIVEVGSGLDYAGVQHTGGEVESKTITKDVQRRMWEWLRNESDERKDQLWWLLSPKRTGTTLKREVPRRPIVGITEQTIEDVREAVGVKIMEAR
jgi:phage gpG-like protein